MNLSAIEDIVKDSIPYSKSEIVHLIADLTQRSLEQQKPQIDDIGSYLEKFKDEIIKEYYLIFQNYSVEPSICIEKARGRITELHKQIEDWKKILKDSPGIIEREVYQLPEDWEGPSDSRPLWPFRKTVVEDHSEMKRKTLAYVKLRNGIEIDLLESLIDSLASSQPAEVNDEIEIIFHGRVEIRDAFYDMILPRLTDNGTHQGKLTYLKALHEVFKNDGLISVEDEHFFKIIKRWLKVNQGFSAFQRFNGTDSYLKIRRSYQNALKAKQLDSYLR